MLSKHRGQRPLHWYESLNITLQNVPGVCFQDWMWKGASCLWLFPQVELHDRRGDSIPEGWGCDAQGKLSTDPKKVLNGGGLVPIGGSEATGGSRADTCLQHSPDWWMFFWNCFNCFKCAFCLTSGGYKGYGLGMMVEVFCGILAGAQYSNNIRTWKVTDRIANLVRALHMFSLSLCLQQKYVDILLSKRKKLSWLNL